MNQALRALRDSKGSPGSGIPRAVSIIRQSGGFPPTDSTFMLKKGQGGLYGWSEGPDLPEPMSLHCQVSRKQARVGESHFDMSCAHVRVSR